MGEELPGTIRIRWVRSGIGCPEKQRRVLRGLGFRKLQHSAGIHPLECRKEIDFLIELHDIRKYVRYIVAEHVDNEVYWKKVFKLD